MVAAHWLRRVQEALPGQVAVSRFFEAVGWLDALLAGEDEDADPNIFHLRTLAGPTPTGATAPGGRAASLVHGRVRTDHIAAIGCVSILV